MAAAPAYALSPAGLTGCFDIPLTDITRTGTQGYASSLSGFGAAQSDAAGTLSYSISQNRTSGIPQGPGTSGTNLQSGEAAPTQTRGDFAVASGANLGSNVFSYGGTGYEHWSTSTGTPLRNNATGNLLILNQASSAGSVKASETISFNFGSQTPSSISFAIFDLTRVEPPSNAYIDAVSFSSDVQVTRISGPTLSATGTVSAGTPVYPLSQYASPSSGSGARVNVVASPTSSTFSLTYSNTTSNTTQSQRYMQSQYIAIGDIRVCF